MRLYYGIESNRINVTKLAFDSCVFNNILCIPVLNRVALFGDPLVGTHKFIFLYDASNNLLTYDDKTDVLYNINTNSDCNVNNINYAKKLDSIHKSLILKHGPFNYEYEEQLMSTRFLRGNEKVLEIGAYIGRNTLVIASILNDQTNLVTMECNVNTVKQLTENRDNNSMKFNIEPSALSKRPLVQKGWETYVSDVVDAGYTKVNTITFNELQAKYNIEFDTLVADCEGALYYIFMDMPEILEKINMIIMENDYHNIDHKLSVDNALTAHGFEKAYSESGGWGPCQNRFFEVWRK